MRELEEQLKQQLNQVTLHQPRRNDYGKITCLSLQINTSGRWQARRVTNTLKEWNQRYSGCDLTKNCERHQVSGNQNWHGWWDWQFIGWDNPLTLIVMSLLSSKNWAWWPMSIILVFRRLRQEDRWVWGQSGLCNEFQANISQWVSRLNNKKKENKNNLAKS